MKGYISGFIICLLLTGQAFALAGSGRFDGGTTLILILVLAIIQLLVQLVFFLHINRVGKAPWNIIVFIAMALIAMTLVFGTLWVMQHLDYGHSHQQTEQYLEKNTDL